MISCSGIYNSKQNETSKIHREWVSLGPICPQLERNQRQKSPSRHTGFIGIKNFIEKFFENIFCRRFGCILSCQRRVLCILFKFTINLLRASRDRLNEMNDILRRLLIGLKSIHNQPAINLRNECNHGPLQPSAGTKEKTYFSALDHRGFQQNSLNKNRKDFFKEGVLCRQRRQQRKEFLQKL